MSGFLSPEELRKLKPAETSSFPSPIPTQIVSSDEFFPHRQNKQQREVEARLKAMGNELARKQGISRRAFFTTAAGMAAAFLAMNEVYGRLFDVTRRRGRHSGTGPGARRIRSRTSSSSTATPISCATIRASTRFVKMRQAVGDAGWNPELKGKKQTIEDLKYNNYYKEIFLDSDTKVALISSAPSDIPRDWFLTNEMMAEAREKVNKAAGSQPPAVPRHLHARHARLARRSRPRPGAQARLRQGLHHRRQHPQGTRPLSLAHGRRESHLSRLREDA